MAYNDAVYYKSRGMKATFDGETIFGIKNLSGFTSGGQVSEIMTGDINSVRKEFTGGTPDGGQCGFSGNALLQSGIYAKFKESNKEGDVKNLNIYFGGIPTGQRATDGRAIYLGKVTTGVVSSAGEKVIKTTLTNAKGLAKGVRDGDFILITSTAANGPKRGLQGETIANSEKWYRIAGYSETTTEVSFQTDINLAAATTAATVLYFYRPAIAIKCSAYCSGFDNVAEEDGIVMLQAGFRISGESLHLIGNQSTEDTNPTHPGLAASAD